MLRTIELHVHNLNCLIPQQHGFVQGRSTTTNLIFYQNEIISSLEKRLQVDSIYKDFSKAFDRTNLKKLLAT